MPTLPLDLGDVLHEPVDGVVGVGGLVDGGRVQRAADGAVHDVVALGAVLAADVLDDADVAAARRWSRWRCRIPIELGPRCALCALVVSCGGAVGRAGEEDAGALRALGNEDDGVQLDAVAHGDHDFAAGVIHAMGWRIEGGGSFAGVVGVLRRLGARRAYEKQERGERNCRMVPTRCLCHGGGILHLWIGRR